MSDIYVIPDELIFSPCKVDGKFWKEFHVLLSYLGQPEELALLKQNDPEQYALAIDCLVTFVRETETELFTRGYLKKIDLEQQN